MAYISQVAYETASPEQRAEIDQQIQAHGRITNMKLTLLHSLPAFRTLMEWYPLEAELESFLGERAVNFFCYAISSADQCLICSTFFRKILKDLNIDFETFAFTEEEQLLVDYGRAIVQGPNHVPPELFERLKAHWNEERIVAITAFAAMMIATNLINEVLQVRLDDCLSAYTQ